ncbi:MAG: hypothetical protein ACKOPN_09435, partial [Prochlorococcaceae cyanobacterium]
MTLWVEDTLTREWLDAIWQDTDIGLLVAGGNEAVLGVVNDAHEAGHNNVFGLRDRDFTQSNQDNWLDPTKNPKPFTPEMHEIENYFLDFEGLAQLGRELNPHGRTKRDLETRAKDHAANTVWWLATRALIAEVRHGVTKNFPKHPPYNENLKTRDDAIRSLTAKLTQPPWSHDIDRTQAIDTHWIPLELDKNYIDIMNKLESGQWIHHWPGKEIFHHLLSYMGTEKSMGRDYALAIARHQRLTRTVD